MIVILPPSEGKASGGDGCWQPDSGRFGDALADTRALVQAVLRDPLISPQGARWTGSGCLPAYRRYSGVVWQHLDEATLSPPARATAASSVLVASALGGLFAWADPVPEYKLKMSARSSTTGRLAAFWQPHLAPLLTGQAVFDLTALEQTRALSRPARADWVRVELVDGQGRRSGHAGKAAKGRLARALLEQGPAVLDGYLDSDGWSTRLG